MLLVKRYLGWVAMSPNVKAFGCRPGTAVARAPAAGGRKPPRKETVMGEGLRGGLHYGDLRAAADAPEARRNDATRWPTKMGLTSRRLRALDAEDCCAI